MSGLFSSHILGSLCMTPTQVPKSKKTVEIYDHLFLELNCYPLGETRVILWNPTNPNNALLVTGISSMLPYICCLFLKLRLPNGEGKLPIGDPNHWSWNLSKNFSIFFVTHLFRETHHINHDQAFRKKPKIFQTNGDTMLLHDQRNPRDSNTSHV